MPETLIFLGNPGSGKSTLLNCLAKRVVFRSGINYGEGLTVASSSATVNGVTYVDTPGLADRSSEREAFSAITDALRTHGSNCTLCFFIRVQHGRVIDEDVVTMERVLDSINVPNVPFALIFNNLSPKMFTTLSRDQEKFKRVVAMANSGKYKSPHLLLVPHFEELSEEDNKIVELPSYIAGAIAEFPRASIPSHAVGTRFVATNDDSVEKMCAQILAIDNDPVTYNFVANQLETAQPNFWGVAMVALTIAAKIAFFC